MKAARLHGPGDLRVENIAAPGPPEPGWVKLNVDAAGICGSDLHNFRTGQWISRAPSTAGHELTGTVVAVGDQHPARERPRQEQRRQAADGAAAHDKH
ncbi:MAG: hypothetical protein EOS52_31370, partial [Mesorhizobium sp.]|uniref:alcohol dehydrogenase catalytic domain-containing protein n=1 Tax=Mesorhizobium sp. TaxID=1871066 RepID=UPI000FE58E27